MLFLILVALAVLVAAGLLFVRRRDSVSGTSGESPNTSDGRETAVGSADVATPQLPVSEPPRVTAARADPGVRPEVRNAAGLAQLGRTRFAVIDVETTGFHPVPDGDHRIVEVAVVRMSPDGRIEDEYVTLVNPERRMSATHVHGIRAADVARAPSFAEIAGDVAARIGDAIIVAHNVPFDLRFLRGEYAHAGMVLPDVPRLCTLDLAYRFADVSCRKLGFLCEEYGIPIDAHSALGDARAVSQLLMRFLDAAGSRRDSAKAIGFAEVPLAGSAWCPTPPSGVSVPRRAREDGARDALEAVVAKCSARRPVAKREQQYLEALELAIADRELTAAESGALAALARDLDVSTPDVHRRYVESLADGAKADGVVTAAEAAEVQRIAALLNVSQGDVTSMLAVPSRPTAARPVLDRGAAVCFVGDFDIGVMTELVSLATARNFIIRKNITASVSAVIVEGAQSNVRRQDRARALGIPVLTSEQFLAIGRPAMASA